jgi:hypothetical protein
MKKTLYPILVMLSLTSCITSSYYMSPFSSSSDPYHAIPLKSDSVKSASYAGGIFTVGGANINWNDPVYSFQANIYRAHNFGHFQAYYGVGGNIGNYHVERYENYVDDPNAPGAGSRIIPENNYVFAGAHFNGGINAVIPFRNGGEWRVIGLETSVQKEFGDYANFRRNLKDSMADYVLKKTTTATFGFATDIIGRSRHGAQFGYKVAWGTVLNPNSDYSREDPNRNINPLFYFSQTLHLTKGPVTGFAQVNMGSYAGSFQFGMIYQLGRKRTP